MRNILSLVSSLAACVGLLCSCSASQPDELVRVRIDADRPLLPCGGTERVVVKVSLDGLRLPHAAQRPPVNLALVIDRSGSMSGDKIAKAREAAIEVIRRLSQEDVFSLVVYDSEVRTLIPARHVRNRGELEEIVQSIRAEGSTALFGGVSQGAAEIRRRVEDRRYVHRVILLSDGQANVGPSSPADLARLGRSLGKEGIPVTTVGLGLGFNEDLMTRLASASDGNTYFAESSRDLPRIFGDELGDVLDVVARRVIVELEFPEHVRPLAFVGREGMIQGRRAEFSMSHLYGGQEKFALVEVEVAPGEAGAERSLAEARVRYEDVRDRREVKASAKGRVRYSEDRVAVAEAVDKKVQVEYASNVIALAKDEAVAKADAGRKEEAASLLRERMAFVAAMPSAAANVELKGKVQEILDEADAVEREGLSNERRKAYRADSVQTKAQQKSK